MWGRDDAEQHLLCTNTPDPPSKEVQFLTWTPSQSLSLFCLLIFIWSVFTWRHCSHIGVPKQWNSGHVGVPNQSFGSFLLQTYSFVPIKLHRCWPCEWKHSIREFLLHCLTINPRLDHVPVIPLAEAIPLSLTSSCYLRYKWWPENTNKHDNLV